LAAELGVPIVFIEDGIAAFWPKAATVPASATVTTNTAASGIILALFMSASPVRNFGELSAKKHLA
jgi:predicted component of type VI protein secretion system